MDEGNENNCVFCNSKLTELVCQNCSRAQPSSFEEEIVTINFIKGYPYRAILKFLDKHHNLKMSLHTFKTKLEISESKHCTKIGIDCQKGAAWTMYQFWL